MNTIIVALILTFNIGPDIYYAYEETFFSMADCVGYAIENGKTGVNYHCAIVANNKVY